MYRIISYIDTNCSAEINAEAYVGENSVKGRCTTLEINYNKMDSKVDAAKDSENQKEINLNTTFSDYKLTSTLIKTEYNLDGFKYGYKNTFDYALLGNTNRYISMNNIYGIENIEEEEYYDNGRAMLTTPILTTTGEYNYNIDYKNIFTSEFKNIIRMYSDNKYNIDRDLNIISCPYKIVERNIKNHCKPTASNNYCGDPDNSFPMPKIKMVYRPINLNYPFPGQDGKGRTPGLNWNIEAINQYITNNRGVTTEEVYKKEPLYVIKLDAKKIREIREYNKENKYDDFTLSCTLGKGTECISEFLREHNLIESGTCKDITSDNFYRCADK